ncbi:hypothetical protein [Paenibacillus donghaensis]|uniref:Uncharacterized protein n=1 Tax=Paenibacillus donghaensis TaxID=414771 RepID=A0A2Z2KTD6_9BACL|nr:hypothetical protein [Paenibacillus donghaensis]ASA22658.1 hypothetical protein B9T62_18800 [Paenibacillus donghaensis]
MKQPNPYELEKIILMMKMRTLNGDGSYLNKFTIRSRTTIEDVENAANRLSNINKDIQKWDAIHKVKELKEYYNIADDETKNIIKLELIGLL